MGRLATLVVLAALAVPRAASADVFKLYGEIRGGGMFGHGLAGDHKAEAFGAKARGGAYGVLVGGRVLIFDGHLYHQQYVNGDGIKTWTQFALGLNFGLDTGTPEQKKQNKGGYVEMGVNLGFGVGTGAQVDPPLDNAQVTDKGFILEGRLGFGKHLSSVFDFGVVIPASYSYLFKSGNGATANMTETHYQQLKIEALLVLRANIRFL